jgi:hypothetical protein
MGDDDAQEYQVEGILLVCPICGEAKFRQRTAHPNFSSEIFALFAALDQAVNAYICERCGHILWFKQR